MLQDMVIERWAIKTYRISPKGLGTVRMPLLVEAEKLVVTTEHVVVADNLIHCLGLLICLVGRPDIGAAFTFAG